MRHPIQSVHGRVEHPLTALLWHCPCTTIAQANAIEELDRRLANEQATASKWKLAAQTGGVEHIGNAETGSASVDGDVNADELMQLNQVQGIVLHQQLQQAGDSFMKRTVASGALGVVASVHLV